MLTNPGKSAGHDQGCLMLMDTDLERKIGLGTSYPFGPLGEGECVISVEEKKVLSIELGSTISMEIHMITMLNNIIDDFNTHTDNITYFPIPTLFMNVSTNLTCTITGFLDTSYEKYPAFPSQVIMEYG